MTARRRLFAPPRVASLPCRTARIRAIPAVQDRSETST
ncbi:hypothetical protein PARU111607_03285 [Palleronia rufa]